MYVAKPKPKKSIKPTLIILINIAIIFIILLIGDFQLRKILSDYSVSAGETLLIKTANEAISELLSENKITYGEIVKLSRDINGNVTSLEIGVEELNSIRSQIAVKIDEKLSKQSDYPIAIPIGTIIGNEFTIGRGPEIKFNMRLTSTVIADFKSVFTSAGINQVLHQILIQLEMNGKVLIPWYNSSFTTNMSCIAAQTVITGVTPNQFTSVNETDPDGIAEDIFNFSMQ